MPLVVANRMRGGGARYANKQISREQICRNEKVKGRETKHANRHKGTKSITINLAFYNYMYNEMKNIN